MLQELQMLPSVSVTHDCQVIMIVRNVFTLHVHKSSPVAIVKNIIKKSKKNIKPSKHIKNINKEFTMKIINKKFKHCHIKNFKKGKEKKESLETFSGFEIWQFGIAYSGHIKFPVKI